MLYCTLDDIKAFVSEDRLRKYAYDENNEIDVTKVNQAIEDAEAEMNAYIQSRYSVPLNPVPVVLKKFAVDIAFYNITSPEGFDTEGADKIIVDRYKAAIKFMENVANGKVLLTSKIEEAKPESITTFEYSEKIFSRKKMTGF